MEQGGEIDVDERNIEEEYLRALTHCRELLRKLNPLQSVVSSDIWRNILTASDVLHLTPEEKLQVKKCFKNWCRTNHPDKRDEVPGKEDEASLHLYKVYSDAFLHGDEAGYNNLWVHMGFTALTFDGVDPMHLAINNISRLIRDIDVLIDIIEQCNQIKYHNGNLAKELRKCLQFVKLYLNAKESGVCTKHSTISIAGSMDLCTNTVIEKSELVDMIINERDRLNIKYHRKRENPTKYTIPLSKWKNCTQIMDDKLPFDIDGLVVYVLPYNPKDKMKSSRDGRNWHTWTTGSRINFKGTRRSATCAGGRLCRNKKCKFLKLFRKQNAYHFIKVDGVIVCRLCRLKPEVVECYKCKKIWEFEKGENVVTVYHHGTHSCTPKPFPILQEGKLRDRFHNTPKVSPQQAVNDMIGECFDDPNFDIDFVNELIDSSLNKQKVKNFKRKVEQERRPYGHSFEAVSHLKTRLAPIDIYIYILHLQAE